MAVGIRRFCACMFPNREPLFCGGSYTGMSTFIYLMQGNIGGRFRRTVTGRTPMLGACCTRIGDAGRIVL